MTDFRYVVEIQVSPARVWSTLLDIERWPDWTPTGLLNPLLARISGNLSHDYLFPGAKGPLFE
ncbi:MAG TPA: hypothetical protein VGF82_10610 [Terracidiphilus sp.]|jgi:uncharacterized protein YndB with AHSA1/START domain